VHEGVELECLDGAALSRENLFDADFDDVLACLAESPRTDAEPDGFFVRTGEMDGRSWRLNGQVHELGDRVWQVDLRGECPFAVIEDFLRLLGWPQTPVVFQPARLGLTLSEEGFRRWSARRGQ